MTDGQIPGPQFSPKRDQYSALPGPPIRPVAIDNQRQESLRDEIDGRCLWELPLLVVVKVSKEL